MSPFPALLHGTCVVAAAVGLVLCASAKADEGLAQNKGCLTCHHAERKGIGPAFRDIAARYRTDAGASALLSRKLRDGGRGAWGDGVMPPNPHVNEAESARLVAWILAMK